MGHRELRDAFNLAAAPHATCSQAYHRYDRDADGKEVQKIEFNGTYADGTAFSIISTVPPKGLLELAARDTAQTLLKERPI